MSKEIQKRASFKIIRYANCWEDPQILAAGLSINENSNCLSIASAGDNSLALLTRNPALIVAVDLSSVQIACTEIRKVAFAELEYNDLLEFLGFKEAKINRLKTYTLLQKYLSLESKDFWDKNPQILFGGLIHQGKFENYFQLFHKYVLPLLHSKKNISALLENKDLGERQEFYDKNWNTFRWRLLFRLFFNRFVVGRCGRDPEFFKYVDDLIISQHLFRRAEYAFTALSTHDNPYLRYVLTGDFGEILPFYIRKENYEIIRNNLDKLKLYKGTISDALKSYDIGFDAFNLSDIFEYMDNELFYQVSNEVIKHANKNARITYWNMLVHRKISDILPEKVSYLQELSENLFKKDQAFFYKAFLVEEVL